MLLALLAQPPVQEQIAGHVRRDDCDEVVNVRGRSLDAHGDVRAGRDVLELHPERLLGELEVRGDLGVSERAVERTRRGTPRRSSRLQKSTLARFSRRGVEARAGRGGHGQALVQEERVAVVVVIALLVRVEDDEREAVARATGQRDLDGVAVRPKR